MNPKSKHRNVNETDLIKHPEALLASGWIEQARQPGAEDDIKRRYQNWTTNVRNPALLARAGKLWRLMTSASVGGTEKFAIIAALLYLISPLDFIPDFIPVLGWLDDLGIAGFVFAYVLQRADQLPDSLDDQEFVEENDLIVGRDNATNLSHFASIGVANSFEKRSRHLEELRKVCQLLQVDTLVPTVDLIANRAQQPLFRIMFVGRYNAGKSMLLNRLLGGDYLLSGPTPTTRAMTYVMSGTSAQLTSQQADGSLTLHEDIADLKDLQNPTIAGATQISLLLPSEILQSGICLIDTPGIEDPSEDTTLSIAREVTQSECVVLMLDATLQIGAAEETFIRNMVTEDRSRKLFIVANKIDRIQPPDRVPAVLAAIRSKLIDLNVQPRVFGLSAKVDGNEESPALAEFRIALTEFLKSGKSDEQLRIVDHQIRSLAGKLLDAADVHAKAAAMSDSARNEKIASLRDLKDRVNALVESKQHQVQKVLDRLEANLNAEFDCFCQDLASTVSRQIDESSLDQLRKTDLIERLIHQETRSFLEPKLAAIQAELGDAADEAVHGAIAEMQRNRVDLKIEGSKSALEANPELATGLILILSFSFMGIFSFLYVLIGLSFGRNMLESTIKALMSKFAETKIKSQLKEQIVEGLVGYRLRISEKLNEQFFLLGQSLRQDVAMAIRAANATEESLLALESSSAGVERKDIAHAREILITLSQQHSSGATDV
jgi:uncharacterized membrane protein YkvA (DUF1232 family)/GTPase Era involved in 16S rRNA processing